MKNKKNYYIIYINKRHLQQIINLMGSDLKSVLSLSEYSSVWLECFAWDEDATGSNPVIPTKNIIEKLKNLLYNIYIIKNLVETTADGVVKLAGEVIVG